MVETMAGSEAFIITMIAFVVGYLTCSTIMLDDLQMKYDDLKEDFENIKKEKEYLESRTNHFNYRDVA